MAKMSKIDPALPLSTTLEVRDTCLCMHVQRAARALARVFDDALRPLDLTHGQFSLMMALNRPDAPTMSAVSDLLGMDRTSLTAKVKPLERRGMIQVVQDEKDRRNRRMSLTDEGRALLVRAVPVWRATHAALDPLVAPDQQAELKQQLGALAGRTD